MATITITLIDEPNYGVSVRTDAERPSVGRGVTPAEALALELLGTSFRRGAEVLYDRHQVPLVALALELIDPDGFGHAIPREILERARRALGRPPIDRPAPAGVDIDLVHLTRPALPR